MKNRVPIEKDLLLCDTTRGCEGGDGGGWGGCGSGRANLIRGECWEGPKLLGKSYAPPGGGGGGWGWGGGGGGGGVPDWSWCYPLD